MSSKVDIANLALSILGKPPIISLTQPGTAAQVLSVEYDMIRLALLRGRPKWRFNVRRASLPALVGAPLSGPYQTGYQLPSDCLAIMQVGDTYPGLDLSDYRLGPTDADYTLEGRVLWCDYGAPLSLKYAADVTDTTLFDPWFCIYLAAEIAWTCCERLTSSDAKQAAAKERKKEALIQAANSNALENPPSIPADDTWIACRMQ